MSNKYQVNRMNGVRLPPPPRLCLRVTFFGLCLLGLNVLLLNPTNALCLTRCSAKTIWKQRTWSWPSRGEDWRSLGNNPTKKLGAKRSQGCLQTVKLFRCHCIPPGCFCYLASSATVHTRNGRMDEKRPL